MYKLNKHGGTDSLAIVNPAVVSAVLVQYGKYGKVDGVQFAVSTQTRLTSCTVRDERVVHNLAVS